MKHCKRVLDCLIHLQGCSKLYSHISFLTRSYEDPASLLYTPHLFRGYLCRCIPCKPLAGVVTSLTFWWLAALAMESLLDLRPKKINVPIMAIMVDLREK